MNIEVLAGNTVKITLNSSDMTDYDIKYENLSRKSPDTKRLLIELLSAVRLEKNLDLLSGRLFIEAFPRSDGGCMLYISSLSGNSGDADEELSEICTTMRSNEREAPPHTLICESSSLEEIIELCRSLGGLTGNARSSLYYSEEQGLLRLALSQREPFSPLVRRLFSEYGKLLTAAEAAAETEEFYKRIISDPLEAHRALPRAEEAQSAQPHTTRAARRLTGKQSAP